MSDEQLNARAVLAVLEILAEQFEKSERKRWSSAQIVAALRKTSRTLEPHA